MKSGSRRLLAVLPFESVTRDRQTGLLRRRENQRAITGGADSPVPLMQNAAIHALRGDKAAALDTLDRAYAAG